VFGPDIVEEVEHLVQQVRENLRVAQTRQKRATRMLVVEI
jgi:hypothetical protein